MQKIYLLLFYKYWLKYKPLVRLLRVETGRLEPNSIIQPPNHLWPHFRKTDTREMFPF